MLLDSVASSSGKDCLCVAMASVQQFQSGSEQAEDEQAAGPCWTAVIHRGLADCSGTRSSTAGACAHDFSTIEDALGSKAWQSSSVFGCGARAMARGEIGGTNPGACCPRRAHCQHGLAAAAVCGTRHRHCLIKNFLNFDTVALSFLFDKYCLIME